MLASVLPLAWPALVRADGEILLGLQTPARSGDPSRDLAQALAAALDSEPGQGISSLGEPGDGPRLQDLITEDPLEVTVFDGFDWWLGDAGSGGGQRGRGFPAAGQCQRGADRPAELGARGVLVPHR